MQKYYSKMFLFASFFITVTTLFSCADKSDNNKENSKTETVANSVTKQNDNSKQISPTPTEIQSEHAEKNIDIIRDDEVVTPKKTSHKNNSSTSVSSSAEENLIKSAKTKENKTLQSEKTNNSAAKVKIKAAPAGEIPSQINAEFPGGIEQFHNFFMKEYKKPESASYWKINLNLAFAVEKNGTVSFLECSPAVEETVEKEMIRVLNLCPKWKPGEFNGKKIKMQYSVPLFLK